MYNFRIVTITFKRRQNNFGNSSRVWELSWGLDKLKVQSCYSWRALGVTLGRATVLTLVPGVKTGRFLSVKCSVTFSQLWFRWTEADVTQTQHRTSTCPNRSTQLDLLLYMLFCRTNTHSSTSRSIELSPAIPHLNLLNKETYLLCYMYIRRTENMYLLLYMLICSLISSL